jgi:hypothetical protein
MLFNVPGARSSLGLSRDRYTANLRWMFELPVAATSGDKHPPVVFKHSKHFANFRWIRILNIAS